MASLWVRYEHEETDSWQLTDELATDLGGFVAKMIVTGGQRKE